MRVGGNRAKRARKIWWWWWFNPRQPQVSHLQNGYDALFCAMWRTSAKSLELGTSSAPGAWWLLSPILSRKTLDMCWNSTEPRLFLYETGILLSLLKGVESIENLSQHLSMWETLGPRMCVPQSWRRCADPKGQENLRLLDPCFTFYLA